MNVKKKGISLLLTVILIALLLSSGAMETTVYAESLGLTPVSIWQYATHCASSTEQVDKVYRLAKAKASSSVASRLHDVMYDATYRPAVNGGSRWLYGWLTSVYDPGLGTTVTFSGSQGCFSYANYISKYVRGSTGTRTLIPQSYPSAEDIRQFLEANADPGEHFHFYNTAYGREHSFIYLASDRNGFYVLSSFSGGNVDVHYCTYEKFHSVLRYDNGPPVVLYDTNGSLSGSVVSAPVMQVSYSDPYKCKTLYQRVLRPSGTTKGSDVTYIQSCLRYLGYSISVDGCYGNGSASVVKKFQSDHGVTPVDGICGLVTWSAIEKAVAQKKDPSRTPSATPTVSSLSVKSKPSKTTYKVGESLSTNGLKIKVNYSNGSSKEITSGFTCSPSGNLSKVGQQKITVSYGGKSTSFYVDVVKTVASLSVKLMPSKTSYTVGESLDTKRLTLKVTYSDGSTKDVSSGFTCSPSGKLSKVGQQKILVSYGGKSTGLYVNVHKAVSSVSIKSKPSKTTYTVGESLVTKGLTLKVTYSDGTSADVSSGFTCSPSGKLSKVGQQKITVSYGGKSSAFYVNVQNTVTSVSVKLMPSKTTYKIGESLDTKRLTLKVTYSDGSTKDVSSGFTCSPSGKFATAGQKKILVSFGGKSTAFYVNVQNTVTSVSVKLMPSKTSYTVGESLDTKRLTLKVTYSDGSTKDVSSGFTCSPSGKLSKVGQQKILVSYGGKATGLYVNVHKAVSSVSVKLMPSKTSYTVGESLDTKRLTLKVTYSDGSTKDVSSGFTCSPSGKLSKVGQQKILVSYGGKATGLYVNVHKAVSSVSVKLMPSKTSYTVGESLDTKRLTLKVTYSDGTSEDVSSGFTCSPSGKLSKVGQQKILVSYGGKATGLYVNVHKAVSSVSIKSNPSKTTYTVGESLVTKGLTLKVTYSDGTSEDVSSGFTCSPSGKFATEGQKKIDVSFGGKTTTFDVNVK